MNLDQVQRNTFYRYCLAGFLTFHSIASVAQPEIAFVSDTQAPMWIETLALKSNHNVTATSLVFHDILKRRPSTLVILGDVVTLGYKEKKWVRMDLYLDSLRRAGVQVSAILGNHDVMSRSRKGESKFQRRFPDHKRTGFYQVVDSVGIIFLNSNFKKLGPDDLKAQQQWYQATLTALDQDPAVSVTVVTCHHAPYSNSKVVGSSKNVQQYFVPGFLASRKARLFLTGHSHNYEHFLHGGKDFLVIGGGGGLHQPLTNAADRLTDLAPEYKPQFHYLVLTRAKGHIRLTSCYLKSDFTGIMEGTTFTIAYP